MPVPARIRGLLLGCLIACLGLAAALRVQAQETLPPAPAQYFNDYAGVITPAVARSLNVRLEQFERATSNQLLVVIYPRMQSDSSVADYTVRVAQSWRVGTQKHDNGAVLFVFMREHQAYIQVGYGLESVLPDALCKDIVSDKLIPDFRAGKYDAGLTAAVSAMIAATKGEYKGTGATTARSSGLPFNPVPLIFVIVLVGASWLSRRRQALYSRGGRRTIWLGGPFGGGGFGGGGGGFSGGGGSFGGGGAGGSW